MNDFSPHVVLQGPSTRGVTVERLIGDTLARSGKESGQRTMPLPASASAVPAGWGTRFEIVGRVSI